MNTIADVWGSAADKWDEVTSQIGDDDWEKTTPCDGWTVRDLVDHAMLWQRNGASALAGIDNDADWATVRPALAAALADPANLEGTADEFGGLPKQAAVGLVTADLLIHSWDLARSIGVDASIDEAAAESTLMGLQRLPDAVLRRKGVYGPAVEVSDDASAQDRLIGFVGRTPEG